MASKDVDFLFNYEILPIIFNQHPNIKKKYNNYNVSVKPENMLIEYLDQLIEDEQEKDNTTKDIQHPVLKSNMLVMGYEEKNKNVLKKLQISYKTNASAIEAVALDASGNGKYTNNNNSVLKKEEFVNSHC